MKQGIKNRALIFLGLAILLPVSACRVSTDNSVNNDASQFGATAGGSANFQAASTVMQTNCSPCHTFGSYSESEFVTLGLVVAGQPNSSLLLGHIRGSAATGGHDMPPQTTLTTGDIGKISNWVQNMGNVAPSPTPATGDAFTTTVLPILTNSCFSCHNGSYAVDFESLSEQDWLASIYLVPGSADTSTLMLWLQGSGLSSGPQSMPLNAAPLSAQQISEIADWINNAVPSSQTSTPAARTQAAVSVITASCTTCHSVTRIATSTEHLGETVPAFGLYTSDAQFVQSGLVYLDNATSSWLIDALQTYGTINAMPENGAPLSETDETTLVNWINGM